MDPTATPTRRPKLVTVLVVAGVTVAATLLVFAMGMLPVLLEIVPAHEWGRRVGQLTRPTLAAFVVAAIFYVRERRAIAYVIAGLALGAHSVVLGVALVIGLLKLLAAG